MGDADTQRLEDNNNNKNNTVRVVLGIPGTYIRGGGSNGADLHLGMVSDYLPWYTLLLRTKLWQPCLAKRLTVGREVTAAHDLKRSLYRARQELDCLLGKNCEIIPDWFKRHDPPPWTLDDDIVLSALGVPAFLSPSRRQATLHVPSLA